MADAQRYAPKGPRGEEAGAGFANDEADQRMPLLEASGYSGPADLLPDILAAALTAFPRHLRSRFLERIADIDDDLAARLYLKTAGVEDINETDSAAQLFETDARQRRI